MVKDDKPFRIVVHIIRGTSTGRALSLMAGGMQCAAATMEDANKIAIDFLDAASALLQHIPCEVCFGVLAILNTVAGTIEYSSVLQGTD